jgi:formylglycine-generating enzyme required for sulfatase activity
VRGEQLVSVGQGEPNAWGLVNHLGNAEEWVRTESGLAVAGGAHTDPLAQCTLSANEADDGAADPATGFRVLREIGG